MLAHSSLPWPDLGMSCCMLGLLSALSSCCPLPLLRQGVLAPLAAFSSLLGPQGRPSFWILFLCFLGLQLPPVGIKKALATSPLLLSPSVGSPSQTWSADVPGKVAFLVSSRRLICSASPELPLFSIRLAADHLALQKQCPGQRRLRAQAPTSFSWV